MSEEHETDARKVAAQYGGTWAPPQVVHVEIRAAELIEDAPLRDAEAIMFQILEITDSLADRLLMDKLTTPSLRFRCITRRDWATSIWVPDHEEYDHEANVLTLYGHWRYHRFAVWVDEEAGE